MSDLFILKKQVIFALTLLTVLKSLVMGKEERISVIKDICSVNLFHRSIRIRKWLTPYPERAIAQTID